MEEEKITKKKRSWIWTLLFVLLNVGVLVWTGLSELNRRKSSGTGFREIEFHWPFLVLAVFCFLILIFSESGKYYSLIKRLINKKDFSTSLKITIYGRYYDNITPSGAGGQPFQIHYLKKHGFPDGASLAIPVYAFLIQQLSFVFTAGLTFLCFGHLFDFPAIRVTAHIGLFFFSLVPVGIILAAVFPRGMWKLIMWILRGLAAIRLIRNPEEKGDKIIGQLMEYSEAINYINKHRRLSVWMILLSVLYQIARCSMPFFILLAFGAEVEFLPIFVATFYLYAAITIIPTPGGAGAAEASFYLIFSDLPEPGLIFWAMLVWRFFSDYVFLLSGMLLTAFEYMQEKARLRRQKRRENREEARQQREREKEEKQQEKEEKQRSREERRQKKKDGGSEEPAGEAKEDPLP